MTDPTRGRHIGHPLSDPGDGRTECERCGKWVWLVTHSCSGVPATEAAMARWRERQAVTRQVLDELKGVDRD